MQIKTCDGAETNFEGLTDKEVMDKTREALADPQTDEISIWPKGPNRHERRRRAALARKKAPKRRRN